MHMCHEEVMGFAVALTGLKFFVNKIRAWFHRRRECKCPNETSNLPKAHP